MLNKKSIIMVWTFKFIIVSAILYEILTRDSLRTEMKALYAAGLVVMMVNDYIRGQHHLYELHRVLYHISIILTIAGSGTYMLLTTNTAASVYYVFPLVEVFLLSRSLQKGIVGVHIFVFGMAIFVSKSDVTTSLISYFAMLLLVYLFRGIGLEREKSQLLHTELAEAHAKLKEITIVKERTRIAQEMHDSLGHSLIALRMHLEFAENVIEAQPQKAGNALVKAHQFAQKSIKELRRAVAVLKDQSIISPIELEELLKDMIESLQTSGTLTFTLHFDKKVESVSQIIKNSIYNTVREAVTNGLKHGKAQQFIIDIVHHNGKINLVVEDNGLGCDQINKSNGLDGIEERFHSLNGSVIFTSEKGRGFKMMAEFPAKHMNGSYKESI